MILFIDDDKREMNSFVKELEYIFEEDRSQSVIFESDVDAAIKTIEEQEDVIDLIILDSMMPPGSVFKDIDTQDGLKTGVRLYEYLRKKKEHLKIIILTTLSSALIGEKNVDHKQTTFMNKEDFLPYEFAYEVKKILES